MTRLLHSVYQFMWEKFVVLESWYSQRREVKVCSHGAAWQQGLLMSFLLQYQCVRTVRQQQHSNMQCNAKYFATAVLPLPQLHRMGLEPIYLHCCCQQSLLLPHSVNKSFRYCGIQLLRQENVAVAAVVAAPCERTLMSVIQVYANIIKFEGCSSSLACVVFQNSMQNPLASKSIKESNLVHSSTKQLQQHSIRPT